VSKPDVIVLRLTPYQTRKLRAQFLRVKEAADKGKRGILAGQFYAPGESSAHMLGNKKVAVARVGFLSYEYATIVAERALSTKVEPL
jgi:hypothetical protein